MWAPLLSGSLAERARASAIEIAESLRSLHETTEFVLPGETEPDVSIASGASGVALALAYLADTGVFPDGSTKAHELFGFSTDLMATLPLNPSLLDGFTGVGWVARRFLPAPTRSRRKDSLSAVDAELLALLARSPWRSDFDLVSGLAGLGLYALDRLPRPSARKALSRIVGHLAEASEFSGSGVAWHTSPALLTGSQRETFPAGHYNLGLAHGVPGVIGLLGQVCSAGIGARSETARLLLSGAVSWLLENKHDGSSRFLYCTGPGVPRQQSRSAWCYGDPGVAAALFVAGRSANEPAWEREAVELALHAATRDVEEAGIVDPGLCHGSAGLAHIFNRFYQATGHPTFACSATYWFERTLAMRQPGKGLAGYSSAVKDFDGQMAYRRDATLLTGASGIAMALAAATTSIEPDWDQVLMLSSVRGPRA